MCIAMPVYSKQLLSCNPNPFHALFSEAIILTSKWKKDKTASMTWFRFSPALLKTCESWCSCFLKQLSLMQSRRRQISSSLGIIYFSPFDHTHHQWKGISPPSSHGCIDISYSSNIKLILLWNWSNWRNESHCYHSKNMWLLGPKRLLRTELTAPSSSLSYTWIWRHNHNWSIGCFTYLWLHLSNVDLPNTERKHLPN